MVTIVFERDFFVWKHAHSALTREAISEYNLQPDEIDGGFEYNNWTDLRLSTPETRPTFSIQGTETREYRVTKSPVEGYVVLREEKAGQWLPFGSDTVYLLKKE